jgi:hypothetical protein
MQEIRRKLCLQQQMDSALDPMLIQSRTLQMDVLTCALDPMLILHSLQFRILKLICLYLLLCSRAGENHRLDNTCHLHKTSRDLLRGCLQMVSSH